MTRQYEVKSKTHVVTRYGTEIADPGDWIVTDQDGSKYISRSKVSDTEGPEGKLFDDYNSEPDSEIADNSSDPAAEYGHTPLDPED